jgi:hypothetical protein
VSALPLTPFGVPDLVWPPGVCEACYAPQWSDALRDWEFVEEAAGPCRTCRLLQKSAWSAARPAAPRDRPSRGAVSGRPAARPSRHQVLTGAGVRRGSR